MKFSLIIPTYNEADGIERLVTALAGLFASANLDCELIVVDDNSPDGTGEIVEKLGQQFPVRCLHRAGKLGLSSAVIDGWAFARPDSEVLGAIDADFSHDIKILPTMAQAIVDGAELAIGSRYVPGGGIEDWPWKRKITSQIACLMAQPLTRVKDITSGYFLVRRSAIEGVELDPIGFKIGLEVIAKARYKTFVEVPYVFTDRIAGKSKLNSKEIVNYLRQLARIYRAKILGVRK